jgi:DNA-directed RNA polymerase specialized sigma24 family protein
MAIEQKTLCDDVNWTEIYRQLYVFARLCSRHVPDIFDGNSAEDMPNIVLLEYFESPTALGWNPEIGPLNRFLLGVLRNKILDCLRRQRRTVGSLDDPDFGSRIYKLQPTLKPDEPRELQSQFREAVKGDRRLEELVIAMERLEVNYKINQQIAAVLNTTVKDIVNRKKRLIRKVKRQGHLP